LTALQNRLHGSDAELRDAISKKFVDQMFDKSRQSGLFMGNFELAARRSKFSVLGVYWPRKTDTVSPPPTLF
jgi:hypothetical protein